MTDARSVSTGSASVHTLIAGTPRPLLWLAGVLAVQLVLAALLALSGPDRSRPPVGAPLLAVDPTQVDAITVEAPSADADDATLATARLRRADGRWTLPDLFDVPADEEQVATLLERVTTLEAGWAVAETPAARRRFEVAPGQFERRITLAQGEVALGALYLGSAPVFRQIHARADGDNAIYVVDFAAYEAPADVDDWIDREALTLPEADIQSIAFADFMLVRPQPDEASADGASGADAFALADLGAEETVDDAAVRRLVSAVARPRFETVVGRVADAAPASDATRATITVSLVDGSVRRYVLASAPTDATAEGVDGAADRDAEDGSPDDGANTPILLTASDNPFVFRLERFAADSLLDADRASLIAAPPAEDIMDPTVAPPLLAAPEGP